jgi:hypothetical protein
VTEAEIRKAYRLLVKVWHPDRFQSDEKLKESAEAKLKEVNSAFEFLTSTSTERGPWRPTAYASADAAPQAPPPINEPASVQPPASASTPVEIPLSIPRPRLWPAIRFSLKAVAVLLALLLGRYIWIAFDAPDPTTGEVSRVYGEGKATVLKGLEAPRRRFVEAVEQDLRRFGLLKPPTPPPDIQQASQPATTADQQAPEAAPIKTSNPHPSSSPPPTQRVLPYITVGSTRDEVLAMQGPPTASSDDKLVYGKSELYLKDGAVTGWRIDPAASPIRVKLWPSSSIDPTLASFAVGSSKDDVLAVQGTPTAFTADTFEYGKSVVHFRNNRVVSWKEDPDSTPLWAR